MSSRLLPALCVVAACAPWALTLPAGAAAAAAPAATVLFDGRGAGHGVGLAQDSAQALALAGASREQVLQRFYPHTGRARRSGPVRVSVWSAAPGSSEVTVALPSGGTLQVGGHEDSLPAGSEVRLWHDASGYHQARVVRAATHSAAVRAAFRSDADPSTDPSAGPTDDPTSDPSAAPGTGPTGDPTTEPTLAPTADPTAEPSSTPATDLTGEPTASGSAAPSTGPTATLDPGAPPSTTSAAPVVLRPTGAAGLRVLATNRSYRGTLTLAQADVLRLVNTVDVESYLQGLGEVPASWSPAALQAQAVAARTYALRAASAAGGRAFDLCDDAHCQVYVGLGNEDPRTTAAVRATHGEVVTYRSRLATTYYSANAGGLTADAVEGLGAGAPVPYLPAKVVAPGPTREWSYRITTADVATALHYPGSVTTMAVTKRGPSGRAEQVELLGSAGSRTVPALEAAGALGLPSTLFTVAGSDLAATAALGSGSLTGTALQLSPDLASLDPQVAPLAVTPGEVPQDVSSTVTLQSVTDHGSDRAAALTIGVVVGALLAMMVISSRRRILAAGPGRVEVDRPLAPRTAAAAPVAPAPVPASTRRGRTGPTLWLTVGAVTVGSAGALAYVRLGRDRPAD